MKEKELREAATCGLCEKKIGESGLPTIWRVTVERHGIKADAVRRQSAFETMMGSVSIAQAMGTDEEMTEHLVKPTTVTVCERCAMEMESLILFRIAKKEA